jgi:TatD DNase family protein
VHSVRAVSQVLQHLERSLPADRARVVLHWFTGSAAEARRAADLGCYFSVNSEMLRSPKHRSLVGRLPRNRLLTETDGPFVLAGDVPVRPLAVTKTVAALAELSGTTTQAMQEQILSNLAALVSTDTVERP